MQFLIPSKRKVLLLHHIERRRQFGALMWRAVQNFRRFQKNLENIFIRIKQETLFNKYAEQ